MAVLEYLYKLEGKLNVAKMGRELGIQRTRCYDIFKRASFHSLMEETEKALTPKGVKLVGDWLEDDGK